MVYPLPLTLEKSLLMNRVRRAPGRMLMTGASAEAIAGKPCPWQPPCALDLLFREHARIGGRHGIPKAWVLAFDRRGFDLIVRNEAGTDCRSNIRVVGRGYRRFRPIDCSASKLLGRTTTGGTGRSHRPRPVICFFIDGSVMSVTPLIGGRSYGDEQ